MQNLAISSSHLTDKCPYTDLGQYIPKKLKNFYLVWLIVFFRRKISSLFRVCFLSLTGCFTHFCAHTRFELTSSWLHQEQKTHLFYYFISHLIFLLIAPSNSIFYVSEQCSIDISCCPSSQNNTLEEVTSIKPGSLLQLKNSPCCSCPFGWSQQHTGPNRQILPQLLSDVTFDSSV